jgi:adenylate cyclase
MVEPGAGAAEERELTILFTDLAGFTNMSEAMTPMQVADFINHHFALVSDCIEHEGGTIDKYIGDAVMAFWGAPQPLLDHAVRGCRAALAIRRAIEADNTKRRQQGMESVHVRIGLHMGPVVVGNIGSERRVNYSIIGDSVNVAARLESQGKELGDPSQEVGILASDSVLDAAGLISEAVEVGSVPLRGRTQTMRVFRL